MRRDHPDLVAIDGVSVTGAGGFPSPFFGTSAAAPHVAALVLEGLKHHQPLLSKSGTATTLFSILQDSAVDLGDSGFDQTFGAGRIDAVTAVDALPAPTPIPSLSVWGLVSLGTAFGALLVIFARRRASAGW